ERSSQLSCGAPRRMPFRTLRVLLTTQSVENCIPTLERAERDINYRAALRVVMPFRTLRVLLTTQSVEICIPTLERGNDHRNYRATLRVACHSGRSASS
ncbi:hypothetical protein, partial [Pseudomonas syringae]|uniref:hypothetical protein n=1 Tax=Pseudomonas syringae TaxID=317 RepID=UPI001C82644C